MVRTAKDKLATLMDQYPKPLNIQIGYGTAGFRARAATLPWVMIRVGALAALRAKEKQAWIGAMITASHNPEHDNGVKLIDPLGEMLDQSWEVYANQLADLDDDIHLLWDYFENMMSELNIELQDAAVVAIAYDTRPSSIMLSNILKSAAQAMNAVIIDFELMTTPQLHHAVRCYNNDGVSGHFTEAGYFDKLCASFQNIYQMTPSIQRIEPLAVDAANGVGAIKLAHLRDRLKTILPIEIFNDGTKGQLNENCGADYVKLYQTVPLGLPLDKYSKCCSIDGDGDRLIYFFSAGKDRFSILDGDRFSVLFASFLSIKLKEAQLFNEVQMGVIQTAYANGSSTDYLQNKMKIPVICVPTGVKHLHHKALDYDIGIYFEANGHGTVVFSEQLKSKVLSAIDDPIRSMEERLAANQIRAFINIINEAVGDALADLLATEAILAILHLTLEGWLNLYHDLPQRQLKVAIKDRTMIKTTDAERRCLTPLHLQERIDQLVAQYPSARAFVRPSGTEDIVRVYAEAAKQEDANHLAEEIRALVQEMTK